MNFSDMGKEVVYNAALGFVFLVGFGGGVAGVIGIVGLYLGVW